jgi:hypothetical protein
MLSCFSKTQPENKQHPARPELTWHKATRWQRTVPVRSLNPPRDVNALHATGFVYRHHALIIAENSYPRESRTKIVGQSVYQKPSSHLDGRVAQRWEGQDKYDLLPQFSDALLGP